MKDNNTNSHLIGKKAAIIGVGFVGASIAYAMMLKQLAQEIVLIDIEKTKVQGEVLDIRHGIPYMGTANIYAGDYSDCRNCDLIIITAGRNRRNGETRLDLIENNSKIIKQVVDNIMLYYTGGVILVVSNPVDILVTLCDKWMGLPNGQIMGTGCILDSSCMTSIVSDYIGIGTEAVQCSVVGEHGDFQIPIWSHVSVGGIPIDEFCKNSGILWNNERKSKIALTVKNMGSSIISTKGRTHYGIATCVCLIADAVLNRHSTIASVSSILKGEYLCSGISLSVPSVIGANGIVHRIEEKWSAEEMQQFGKCAKNMKDIFRTLGNF